MHDDSRTTKNVFEAKKKKVEPGRTPSVPGKENKEVGNHTTTKKPC